MLRCMLVRRVLRSVVHVRRMQSCALRGLGAAPGRAGTHRRAPPRPRASLQAEQPGTAATPAPATRLLGALLGGPAGGPAAARVLAALLSSPSAPIGSYAASPERLLHRLDPRVKQAWLLALLLLPGQLSLGAKAACVALLAALTVLSLPLRDAGPQLLTLGALCALLFAFTALGADSLAPLAQARAPPAALEGLPQLQPLPSGYSYTLLSLGPLRATRRGVQLAANAASLAFCALQGARLCLCTTPPEALAASLAWLAEPLRRVPPLRPLVDEAVLALLLSLRFCSLVFEQARNLALALACRGVDWAALGPSGWLEMALQLLGRLMANLQAESRHIAEAMVARGYAGPEQARCALRYASPLRLRAADGVALLLLAACCTGVARGAFSPA